MRLLLSHDYRCVSPDDVRSFDDLLLKSHFCLASGLGMSVEEIERNNSGFWRSESMIILTLHPKILKKQINVFGCQIEEMIKLMTIYYYIFTVKIVEASTVAFSIEVLPGDVSDLAMRFFHALATGCVPVVVGGPSTTVPLPFAEADFAYLGTFHVV